MAALSDLPDANTEGLSRFAISTLEALERGQDTPWLRSDRSIDAGYLALVARGIQGMSKAEQESYFHRLGEAVAESSAFVRQSTELLYHSTECLNAAAFVVNHPAAQESGRDDRLNDIPSHFLDDLHLVLANALMQHARDLPAETPALQQDALILFARDTQNGLGISDDVLASAILETQATYFDKNGFGDRHDPRLVEPLRDPALTMSTLQDFVQNDRFIRRFSGDVPEEPDDANPAENGTASAPVEASKPAEAAAQGDSPSERGPADNANDAGNGSAPKDVSDQEMEASGEQPPMPDDGWIPVDDAADDLFADSVLREPLADPAPADHDWPNVQRRTARTGQHHRQGQAGDSLAMQAGRNTRNGPGTPPSANLSNPLGLPATPPMANPFPATPSGMPAGNGGTTIVKGPGLFGGLAQLASSLRNPMTASGTQPLRDQMAVIHAREAAQREAQRENRRLQETWQQADSFVGDFNNRLSEFRSQPPVQDMLRQVQEDKRRRQEAIRDGADSKTQLERHKEWEEQSWEKLFVSRPELREKLRGLEEDAQKIPERAKPALAALEQLDRDSRDTTPEREALLSKISRAKINSEELPASVPGKKKLGEILGEILTVLRNFLARIFGLRPETPSTPEAVTPTAVASTPTAQPVRRRAGP